jgi:hypothetical protein
VCIRKFYRRPSRVWCKRALICQQDATALSRRARQLCEVLYITRTHERPHLYEQDDLSIRWLDEHEQPAIGAQLLNTLHLISSVASQTHEVKGCWSCHL